MLSRGQAFDRARSLTAVASVLFLLVIGATGVRAQNETASGDPSPSPVPSETPPTASPETEAPTPPTPTPAASADPTPAPTVTPAPSSAEPTPAPIPAPTDGCLDFISRAEAQAFYESEGGPGADPHGLDPDGDGIACDNLQDAVDTADANSDPGLGEPDAPADAGVDAVERTLPRNTIKLVSQLECGLTKADGVVRGMGRFPVAGRAYYSDDWHRPRYTPTFHLHKGLDIFAAFGTPVRAPAGGRVTRLSDSPSSGGIGVSMEDDERNWYYFGHLQARADGLFVGGRVESGTVLGYVGDTGNAKGGAPHVHMEIHRNGVPIPPKPTVDRWLDEAMGEAPECVRSGPDAAPQPTATPAPAPVPAAVVPTTTPREPTIIAPESVSANSRNDSELIVPLFVLVAASIFVPLLVRRRKRDEYSLIGW